MKKITIYTFIIFLFIIVYLVNNLYLKVVLLIATSLFILINKYKSNKLTPKTEVFFDERIEFNIYKWSTKILCALNFFLILILFLSNQFNFIPTFTTEFLLVYLLISICVPFYILPAVLKHY